MRAMAPRRRGPTLSIEKQLWAEGHEVVVGIDEVGRGAWAGPLTLGAAVLPRDRRVNGIRDSKQLTEARREQLYPRVTEWCTDWAVGHATAAEAALKDQRPDEATVRRAAQLAADASEPGEDLRGSVEYKKDMVRVLTGRALRKAVERAGGA